MTGRPRTGRKPVFVVRITPAAVDLVRTAARTSAKQIGQWLEEAIKEQIAREQGEGDVTKADS